MDAKDRFGDKLHDVEHAREEQWAHQRDEELLEKLRKKGDDALCPQCRKPLVAETRGGVGDDGVRGQTRRLVAGRGPRRRSSNV